MWYWVLLALLIIGSIALLCGTFMTIKKNKAEDAAAALRKGRKHRREKDESEDEDDDDEEEAPPRKKKRRQWKIILEDLDTWQKYSYIFYDTVGIGRSREGNAYEKYLVLPTDVRVSKVHCVIMHRGDKLYLKDENSRNGTFLNGNRISHPVVIQKEDVIRVGETRLEVQRILRESE